MADLRTEQYKDLKSSYDKLVTVGADGGLEDGKGQPVDVTKTLERGIAGNNYTKHINKARLADTEVLYIISPFIADSFNIYSIEVLLAIRKRPAGDAITGKFIFSVQSEDTQLAGYDMQEVYNNDPANNFSCDIIEGNETFTVRVKNISGGSIDVASTADVLTASFH